jgi:hypothetical protein
MDGFNLVLIARIGVRNSAWFGDFTVLDYQAIQKKKEKAENKTPIKAVDVMLYIHHRSSLNMFTPLVIVKLFFRSFSFLLFYT